MDEIDELKRKLRIAQKQIDHLCGSNEALRNEIRRLREQLEALKEIRQ